MKSRARGKSRKRAPAEDEDLVKTEIDAAKALAELASFPPPREDCGVRLRWSKRRKRSGKPVVESSCSNMVVMSNSAADFPLVKDEYPSDSDDKERGVGGGGLPLVAYNRFDTSDDSLTLDPGFRAESPSSPLPPIGSESFSTYLKSEVIQQSSLGEFEEKPVVGSAWSKHRGSKHPKVEDAGLALLHSKEKRGVAAGSSKGRANRVALTEEEKELRRLRRIEANRESARQTIRRKQKMCEEMSMKAKELSVANEQYRKEIEAIREENRRLYETGCSLRKQITEKYGELGNSTPASSESSAAGSKLSHRSEQQSLTPKEPVTEMVQLNRQDDSVEELVEFSTQAQESIATAASTKKFSRPVIASSTHLSTEQLAKIVGVGIAAAPNGVRGYYSCPVQQSHYSFYTGRKDAIAAATAAQARRRRKELTRSKNLLARDMVFDEMICLGRRRLSSYITIYTKWCAK